mgnify:FL=1
MSVGWKCKCGHMNIRKDARVGTFSLISACELSCGNRNIMVPFEQAVIE